MFLDYIIQFHLEDCLAIISAHDILGYYSLKIDFLKLFETYPDIGDKVLCSPITTLAACNANIVKAQQMILEQDQYQSQISKFPYTCLKKNVHARFFGLPVCPELHRTVFPKNVDLGCFLKITGTIVRVTQAKMLEYQRKYVCSKCKYENVIEADLESRYILKPPSKCGNSDMRCKCSTFNQVNLISREHCKDYQEVKMQEQVNKLSIGTIPGSMWVVFEDDLVDSCKPGDDVIICGTVRRRWRPCGQNKKLEVELVLQANYVEVCNAQRSKVIAMSPDIKNCFDEFWLKYKNCPLKGRDQILATVCPQVYGLHLVKLAVLLTVITGSDHLIDSKDDNKSAKVDKYTTHVRGQCHLLLVGDPGTGKSQLLKAGAELTPRSVFTSGAGSTRAGLTCAALREDGEWQLEAGALVLSDGGVCCIDEISHLRDHDRTAIHEAMEQQTISVAKAGIVCKLNTRCAVIAACNPKGQYQTDEPLSVNVSLGTPLLSRFDLIFILLDSKNKTWDNLVSTYILFGGNETMQSKMKWTIEKLQTYIGLIGPKCTKMTKSANTILQSYYMVQRKSAYRDPSRTTVRMLDSLIRLSQAHCRLMYRDTILPVDAIVAVTLVDLSMQDCTMDDTVNALHSTFQKYPDYDYLCIAKKLMGKLNLDNIWQEELLNYAKLLQVDHKTLESDLLNGNVSAFAKYDEESEDNFSISDSPVTSSYFKNKHLKLVHSEEKDILPRKENSEIEVNNDRLAVTLKKHANLNKTEKLPQLPQKRKKTRIRKTVQIETGLLNKTKKRSKSKLPNYSNDSSGEETDINSILNAVPSVNDVYTHLGINILNQECDHDKIEVKPKIELLEENIEHAEISTIVHKEVNENKITKLDNTRSADKLKKYEYKEKKDISKLCDNQNQVNCNQNNKELEITILEDTKNRNSTSSTTSKRSIQSSQISIFESSDCDIDLEI